MSVHPEVLPVYRFGPFELDPRSAELRRNGVKLKIQEQPYQVLLQLLEHPGEIVSREELRASIWPADTFVDFETGLNTVIKRLRETLGDSAGTPTFIETIPRRGYRFVASVATQPRGSPPTRIPERVTSRAARARSRYLLWAASAVAIVLLSLLVTNYLAKRRSHLPLTEEDAIVVGDFANSTGDPVFDDTLKQAVSIGLQQSPRVRVLSDQRIKETLGLMERAPDESLNEATAREICQRTGSSALLAGSISSLGSQYVLGLKAVNCGNGDVLALEQAQAARKEDVLRALDPMVTNLRSKMGESLASVQKFDRPLEQATTSSLEALKAYSLGVKAVVARSPMAGIPFVNRAIELDPNFPLAYALLGNTYGSLLGESGLASENMRKAYALRDRVSERERFHIAADYYAYVTGELEKAIQTDEVWSQTYPRDEAAYNHLATMNEYLGQYDKSAAASLAAIRLRGESALDYSNLMEAYTALNRLKEAKVPYDQAIDRKLDNPFLHDDLYSIAFLEGDTDEMKRQVAWATGKSGAEDILLSADSDSEASYGHLNKARALSQQAVGSAQRAELKETAALWQLNSALREAEFGNSERARRGTRLGLTIASTRDVRILAALTLARVGDAVQAERMAAELETQNPSNTVINSYWLPTIRAYLAIARRNPAQALKMLDAATPYDLAFPPPQFEEGGLLYPAYVRGQTYLLLLRGREAAGEFQKVLDHPGIVINSPIAPLAHLGLARAFSLHGDPSKARAAYQDFFSLWKDAEPDIPILKQAKAEYVKLQWTPMLKP